MTKRQKMPTPIYVRPTPELRAGLDKRCKEERRKIQAVVVAALEAYLSTPVRP